MRVLHVTHNVSDGGAGIAAYRIFRAVREQPNVEARMVTTSPLPTDLQDPSVDVFCPRNGALNRRVESAALHLQKSTNQAHRTLGLFDSGLADYILSSEWDLLHLHWIGLGTLSIKEIQRLTARMPTIWTLHDSWPFCGAEHHPHFENDERFMNRYTRSSRLSLDSRLDIDSLTFARKLRYWRSPITLVAPTRFMADNAKKSFLAGDWPVKLIPHPIDSQVFRFRGEESRRRVITSAGLDPDLPTVLFVSSAGSDKNKGLDLLQSSLSHLQREVPNLQVVTIGGPWQELTSATRQLPAISDVHTLASWYSAVDLVLNTSRLESFSLVAAEAQACGTPVISFQTSGLNDVVGLLRSENVIRRWDTHALANRALACLTSNVDDSRSLAREAQAIWNPHRIGAAYVTLGRNMLP